MQQAHNSSCMRMCSSDGMTVVCARCPACSARTACCRLCAEVCIPLLLQTGCVVSCQAVAVVVASASCRCTLWLQLQRQQQHVCCVSPSHTPPPPHPPTHTHTFSVASLSSSSLRNSMLARLMSGFSMGGGSGGSPHRWRSSLMRSWWGDRIRWVVVVVSGHRQSNWGE